MKRVLRAAGLIVAMATISHTAFAQWPAFKMAGVPRNPDGKPNLTAPTPRTPDGKPDLSGLWDLVRGGGGQRGQRGQAGQNGQAATPAAPPAAPSNTPPVSTFKNIGSAMPGGLPLQPWAADLVKKRVGDNDKDNPDAHCLPMGFMQFHNHPEPRKIVQTPD